MNVRIFGVRAMKCMCAQTRPRFILSSERVLGVMEFEPMLTPRGKSPLPENIPRGGSNPQRCGQRAQALPTELFRPHTASKSGITCAVVRTIDSCTLVCRLFVSWSLNSLTTYKTYSEGRICSEKCTCCHIRIEATGHTCYLSQSRNTNTGPTSPNTDPSTPGRMAARIPTLKSAVELYLSKRRWFPGSEMGDRLPDLRWEIVSWI